MQKENDSSLFVGVSDGLASGISAVSAFTSAVGVSPMSDHRKSQAPGVGRWVKHWGLGALEGPTCAQMLLLPLGTFSHF